jgi:O-antigen/teichoic acid export membrane protein
MEEGEQFSMSPVSRIRRNSIFAVIATLTRVATTALMFIMLARQYGPELFGQFAFAYTYLTTFYLVADFGFDVYLASEVARDRLKMHQLVQSLLPLRICLSLLSAVLMCLVALLSGIPDGTKEMMVAFAISILPSASSAFFFALFKGLEEFQHETRVSLIQNSVLLTLLIGAGAMQLSIRTIVWMYAATRLLGLLILVPKVRHTLLPFDLRAAVNSGRAALRKGFPYGVFLVCGTLYFQLDTIMLGYFLNEEAIGVYQAAFKLVGILLLSNDILVQIMLPVLSRLHADDVKKWGVAVRLLAKNLVFVGMLFGVLVLAYPNDVLSLVYGPKRYEASAPILRIFALIFIARSSAEVFALMLTTGNNQIARTRIVVFLTLLNFSLNLLVIPRFGTVGAALVSLVTNVVGGGLYVRAALRSVASGISVVDTRLAVSIGVGALVPLTIWFLGIHSFPIGGSTIFFMLVLIFLILGYTSAERRLLFSFSR